MRHLAGAVLAVGVLFAVVAAGAAAGWGGGALAAHSPSLPLPEVGETTAEILPDGTPVFVVRHGDGGVTVLGAINPHLDVLAVWCPRARIFDQPGPSSRWDEHGRYLGGPAPRGLDRYEVAAVTDEAVTVGARSRGPGRGEPPLAPAGPPCGYEHDEEQRIERHLGVVGHDLDALYGPALSPGEAPLDGRLRRYAARVHLLGEGTARLCGRREEPGCAQDAPPIRSFFHRDQRWAGDCRGVVDYEVLARAHLGGFDDVATVAQSFTRVGEVRFTPVEAWPECTYEPRPDGVGWIAGWLVALEEGEGGWTAVLDRPTAPLREQHRNPPLEGFAAAQRWPLHPRDAWTIYDWSAYAEEVRPGQRMPKMVFTVEELRDRLAGNRPLPVSMELGDDGTILGLEVVADGDVDWWHSEGLIDPEPAPAG